MKQKYDITGMTCAACQAHVTKSVEKVEGVRDVNVNLLQNSMTARRLLRKLPASKNISIGMTKHKGTDDLFRFFTGYDN